MKKNVLRHSPFAFYFVCVLCSLSCIALIILVYRTRSFLSEIKPIVKTEKEYIYVTLPPKEDTPVDTIPTNKYFVKEYMGMIGIFDEENTLLRIIEVYTKTLPEADRRLLEEGFEITNEKQLASIIQDYSS